MPKDTPALTRKEPKDMPALTRKEPKDMPVLRTDTTREFFLKRKLINYTKNELQGINILKLRLPNGLKCCLKFFYCQNG